ITVRHCQSTRVEFFQLSVYLYRGESMSTASRPRVLIADDHVLVAEALQKLLSTEFAVVGIVHDGRSLIQSARTLTPDVVLVDISMPVLNGLHAAERIKHKFPHIKVVYVTVTDDPEIMAESLDRGADGYVLKTSAPSELVDAIRCALQGRRYVSEASSMPDSSPPLPAVDTVAHN